MKLMLAIGLRPSSWYRSALPVSLAANSPSVDSWLRQ
jgi:hypothetical protein